MPSGATSRSITGRATRRTAAGSDRPVVQRHVAVAAEKCRPRRERAELENVARSSVGASSGTCRPGPARRTRRTCPRVDQHGGAAVVGQNGREAPGGRARLPARPLPPVAVDEVDLDHPPRRRWRVARRRDEQPGPPAVGSTTAPTGPRRPRRRSSTSVTAPSASTVRTHGPDPSVPAVSTTGSVGDEAVTCRPAQSSSRPRGGGAAGSAESTGQLRSRPVLSAPTKIVRPSSVREPRGTSAAESLRADHPPVLDEQGEERVPRLRMSRRRNPWAASRSARSSNSAVPDGPRAGSRRRSGRSAGHGRGNGRPRCSARTASRAITIATGAPRQSGRPATEAGTGRGLGPGLLAATSAEFGVGPRRRRLEEVALAGGQLGTAAEAQSRAAPNRAPR